MKRFQVHEEGTYRMAVDEGKIVINDVVRMDTSVSRGEIEVKLSPVDVVEYTGDIGVFKADESIPL